MISKWIVELKKERTLSDTLIIFDKFVLIELFIIKLLT